MLRKWRSLVHLSLAIWSMTLSPDFNLSQSWVIKEFFAFSGSGIFAPSHCLQCTVSMSVKEGDSLGGSEASFVIYLLSFRPDTHLQQEGSIAESGEIRVQAWPMEGTELGCPATSCMVNWLIQPWLQDWVLVQNRECSLMRQVASRRSK